MDDLPIGFGRLSQYFGEPGNYEWDFFGGTGAIQERKDPFVLLELERKLSADYNQLQGIAVSGFASPSTFF